MSYIKKNKEVEDFECSKVEAFKKYEVLPQNAEDYAPTQKLTHFTYVFNIFVFLQIFNIINSRKIEASDINVFKDFFNNFVFLFVMILTVVFQIAIVEYGGRATKTVPFNLKQNAYSIALGSTSLIWGFILKFLPIGWWQCMQISDKPLTE